MISAEDIRAWQSRDETASFRAAEANKTTMKELVRLTDEQRRLELEREIEALAFLEAAAAEAYSANEEKLAEIDDAVGIIRRALTR
jgi:hypothetical protein